MKPSGIDAQIGQEIFGDMPPKRSNCIYTPPAYTTDWEKMKQVVDEMKALGFYLITHGGIYPDGNEHAEFIRHGISPLSGQPGFGESGATLPLAVGLAALKTVRALKAAGEPLIKFQDSFEVTTSRFEKLTVIGHRMGLLGIHRNGPSISVSHLPTGSLLETFNEVKPAYDLAQLLNAEFTPAELNFDGPESVSELVLNRLKKILGRAD